MPEGITSKKQNLHTGGRDFQELCQRETHVIRATCAFWQSDLKKLNALGT
jgi:hypothetical protein